MDGFSLLFHLIFGRNLQEMLSESLRLQTYQLNLVAHMTYT